MDSAQGVRLALEGAFETATPQTTPPEIHIVLNWFEELKRLVPTR